MSSFDSSQTLGFAALAVAATSYAFTADPIAGVVVGVLLVAAFATVYFMSIQQKILLKDPKKKYTVALIEREEISHDVHRFRFGLPSAELALGLPIGKHVYMSATVDGSTVVRPYTPITSDDDKGFFDLMIKVYFKGVNERFPEGGKMTQYMNNMKIGDTIHCRGPTGHISYRGNGHLTTEDKSGAIKVSRNAKQLGMIAGGSGITPMLQIARDILKNKEDKTEISLLYANQTENDILCRNELEEMLNDELGRFKLWYTLDRPPASWDYSAGFINEEMIKDHLPAFSKDAQILMCGPPPMLKYACIPNLEKLGFNSDNFLTF
eukprot:gene15587-1889_t